MLMGLGAESEESDDVLVRNDEPWSIVVKADERLGALTAEDPEAREARRRGWIRDLRDPKGRRGVRRVILNSSSSS